MKLIENFRSESFSRIIWVNPKAREVWEPIIQRVGKFVQDLEVESVVHGERLCSWQTISEERVPLAVETWARSGLVALPVSRVGNFQGFAHHHTPPVEGKVGSVCYAISKTMEHCLTFKDAFFKGDHKTQGRLLGFPECCTTFFENTWNVGYFDPMWQAASDTPEADLKERKVVLKGHSYSNPLLRYVGVRVGFHIPCSFHCDATINIAESRLSLGKKIDEGLTTLLLALLNMPMKWDVLHGICVVKTPIFYIIAQSVPSEEQYVVEVGGTFVPREI